MWSRRRNEPLFLAEFADRDCRVHRGSVRSRVRRAESIRYLEGVYLQARLGLLLSQHAGRSDVVISERNGRYLVLSAETDAAGALAMSTVWRRPRMRSLA